MTATAVSFDGMFWHPSAALLVAAGQTQKRPLAATVLAAICAFALILAAAPTTSSLTGSGPEMRVAAQTDTSAALVGFETAGSPVFVGDRASFGYDGALGCCVAPRVADDFVDLASPQRRTHILDGDATGGGHRWPGAPDKTPFPQGWSDDQIMHHVPDVATDPSLSWNWTKGGPSGYTRAGDPGRASVFGVRDGVCIKVVVEPAAEGIITAHPSPGSR